MEMAAPSFTARANTPEGRKPISYPKLDGRIAGRIQRRVAWPSLHSDSRDESGGLNFIREAERFDLIADCEVFDCRPGSAVRPRDLGEPFGDEQRRLMTLPGGRASGGSIAC